MIIKKYYLKVKQPKFISHFNNYLTLTPNDNYINNVLGFSNWKQTFTELEIENIIELFNFRENEVKNFYDYYEKEEC